MRNKSKGTNNKYNNNKRGNYRPKDKDTTKSGNGTSEMGDRGITKGQSSSNNPEWYAADPAILRDAASFPFSWPTGQTTTHDLTLYEENSFKEPPYAHVPGIISLRTAPTIGWAERATDPINVASQALYSFVRHANSGHFNYDAPDLMLYVLGMASNYSFLVWCQRLYGYALTYDQRNRYIGDELIRVNGVDSKSIHNNLANFRFWINTLIAKMASFAVPATLSIFSRMSFMYSDYYIEGTSIKEQLYQYVPDGFHKFIIDSSDKGRLDYVEMDKSKLMTYEDIVNFGNDLFGSIWDQEDFGIMSGDILKAYGNAIIKLVSIPETYQIAPKFDSIVLTQMKNALILDAAPADISQSDDGLLVSILTPDNYQVLNKTYFGTDTVIDSGSFVHLNNIRLAMLKDWKTLTIDMDEPTPDVIMESTRLMYGYDAHKGELHTGSEYVRSMVVTWDYGKDMVVNQLNVYSWVQLDASANWGKLMAVMKNFHYMPRLYAWNNYKESHGQLEEYFDLDNFAVLDNSDIEKLHTAAVINMYAVPSVGKVQ
jgi:hypothetical protein